MNAGWSEFASLHQQFCLCVTTELLNIWKWEWKETLWQQGLALAHTEAWDRITWGHCQEHTDSSTSSFLPPGSFSSIIYPTPNIRKFFFSPSSCTSASCSSRLLSCAAGYKLSAPPAVTTTLQIVASWQCDIVSHSFAVHFLCLGVRVISVGIVHCFAERG